MKKQEKGITLIALVISIIILLILAVVTINAIQGDGIIAHAQNAATEYKEKSDEEAELLENYLAKIEGSISGGGSSSITLAEAQSDAMLDSKTNSTTYDIYGNKIVIPAGFKILVDSTTVYTANDISVTKGIVITDGTNEFVWVPVGTIYTNTDKTESKTITLGRYSSFTKNTDGEYVPAQTAANYATQTTINNYYTEYTADNHNEDYDNAIAKSIKDFCLNSIANGGYYIGRFEAGKSNDTLVCKANQQVYNEVNQPRASSLSQNMYKDATTFTSDLVNSYAWDTAIIFIQTFGGNDSYYDDNNSTSFANTGVNNDKYCNIYDMSGNAHEWSTETNNIPIDSCVCRGGSYYIGSTYDYASTRYYAEMTAAYGDNSFRPLIYVGL